MASQKNKLNALALPLISEVDEVMTVHPYDGENNNISFGTVTGALSRMVAGARAVHAGAYCQRFGLMQKTDVVK